MSLTAGALSLISTGSTIDTVAGTAATGGTTPYSYQWYRSTITGFSPGSGNAVAGATALLLNDSGLTPGTQYYYKMVVKDSAGTPATASYAQLGVIPPVGKLGRFNSLLFGSSAGAMQIGEFGSYAAASPAYSTNPATIQSLSAWLEGWFGAVVGFNNPCMEDMNAFCYVISYFLCYIMQSGIPEYNSATNYYAGSMCRSLGQIYTSVAENNQGNLLTDPSFWEVFLLYRPIDFVVLGRADLLAPLTQVMIDRVNFNITITNAYLFTSNAGSSGTLAADIQYKRGAGAWTSIFSTTPSVPYTAGDFALSTNQVLSTTSLLTGDILRLNLATGQVGQTEFHAMIEFVKA